MSAATMVNGPCGECFNIGILDPDFSLYSTVSGHCLPVLSLVVLKEVNLRPEVATGVSFTTFIAPR